MGITSPPYNKKFTGGERFRKIEYDIWNDNIKENLYQKGQIDVLNELYRVIKPGGSFFYNNKIKFEKGKLIHPYEWLLKTKWTIRQEIIWDRTLAVNFNAYRFNNIDERIYWLYKPINGNIVGKKIESKHANMNSIWKIYPEMDNPHPAPFPIELPTRCIYSILDGKEDGNIIDPYCGSGTTGVVCKYFEYNFTGIDISENYLNHAEQRIKNAKSEFPKIVNEIKLHITKKRYKPKNKKETLKLFF